MTTIDLALFILRIVLGVIFIVHGGQKLFGWLGGPRIKGTIGMVQSFNVAHPVPLAWMAALAEFVGGLLVLLGLFTSLGAALTASSMITAIAMVHGKKGLLNTQGGYEFNLSLIAIAVALMLTGAGAFSLDSLIGLARPLSQLPGWVAVILVLIVMGGVLSTEYSRSVKASRENTTNTGATNPR